MQNRLTIDHPAGLGDRLANACRDVCARVIDVVPGDVPLLDARLACGDFEGILSLLSIAPPSPALPLFLARCVRWTGDLQSAAGIWDRVTASLDAGIDTLEPALRRASFNEVAAAATDLGDASLAARLLGLARAVQLDPEGRDSRHLEEGPGSPGGRDGMDGVDGTRSMDGRTAEQDSAVRFVLETAFSTIGIEPDASRGRLRLRPRLGRMSSLHVRGIRFADAMVSFQADWNGGDLTLRVDQDAGSIPLTLLLEPFVLRPRSARVDGQPADLSPQDVEGGTIVPVQLVLDDVRSVVISCG